MYVLPQLKSGINVKDPFRFPLTDYTVHHSNTKYLPKWGVEY